MDSYEINRETCAIISVDENNARVLEEKNEYFVNQNTYEIMDNSCQYYGSSCEGRIKGTKMILGSNYKVPIVVEDSNNLIIFPTTSPQSEDCAWISLKWVSNIEKVDLYNTKIIFDNDKEIIVPCSFRSIENQLSRASRLDLILRNRKNS